MNRSQERAKTRSKRTPRGAARAKRRLSYVLRRKPAPDANCITMPDGGCESVEPCMHTVEP